jgi:hypothetical protein
MSYLQTTSKQTSEAGIELTGWGVNGGFFVTKRALSKTREMSSTRMGQSLERFKPDTEGP